MNVLIAITSCHRMVTMRQDIRVTWLAGCAVNYRFFLGRGDHGRNLDDEVILDAPDDYAGLPFKRYALVRWSLERGYDYVFKCDDDTYVRPERLVTSGFTNHDYIGFYPYETEVLGPPGTPHAYASGGSGYWLSRRAMELLVTVQPRPDRIDPIRGGLHGEDVQTGWILGDRGIACHRDERYRLHAPGPRRGNDTITLHDVQAPLRWGAMRQEHQRWLDL